MARREEGAARDPRGLPRRLGRLGKVLRHRGRCDLDPAFGSLLSFFNLGAWGALYAVTPEPYPTRIGNTGAGWAAGFGRLASIIAPLCVPALLAAGGVLLPFAGFTAVFANAAAPALTLPDLRGTALDD